MREKLLLVELELADELERICKKHDIPYIMDYGTLLGAVRHKGFIPWDDDMDFSMLRPDYQRFIEIAPTEVRLPFSFQLNYMTSSFCKLRNDETCALEFPWLPPSFSQGIGIDIFPIDDVGDSPYFQNARQIEWELMLMMAGPEMIERELNSGRQILLPKEKIRSLMQAGTETIQEEYRNFCASHVKNSPSVAYLETWFGHGRTRKRSWWENRTTLPFEDRSFPAPVDYDDLLTTNYGDYMTPVCYEDKHHHFALDPDHSYRDYLPGGSLCDPELEEGLRQMGLI